MSSDRGGSSSVPDRKELNLEEEWVEESYDTHRDTLDEPQAADEHPLSPQLKDIGGKLGRIREDIQQGIGDIRKIGATIARGFEAIQDAIYDNIQAQAELKILEHVAEAESVEDQIDAEYKQIEREQDELESKLENIRERYQERYEELDETAEERIRDIGEHIFEIMEDEFEAAIEAPFVEHVTDAWEKFQRHNIGVKKERRDALRTELSETHRTIDAFLEGRETLLNQIENHRLDLSAQLENPQSVQVPYWVVTVETAEGTRREVVAPSHLRTGESEWFTGQLDPIEGFKDPIERAADRTDLGEVRRRKVSREDISETLDAYSEEKLNGQVNFADGVAEAVGEDSVTIEIEEG